MPQPLTELYKGRIQTIHHEYCAARNLPLPTILCCCCCIKRPLESYRHPARPLVWRVVREVVGEQHRCSLQLLRCAGTGELRHSIVGACTQGRLFQREHLCGAGRNYNSHKGSDDGDSAGVSTGKCNAQATRLQHTHTLSFAPELSSIMRRDAAASASRLSAWELLTRSRRLDTAGGAVPPPPLLLLLLPLRIAEERIWLSAATGPLSSSGCCCCCSAAAAGA